MFSRASWFVRPQGWTSDAYALTEGRPVTSRCLDEKMPPGLQAMVREIPYVSGAKITGDREASPE